MFKRISSLALILSFLSGTLYGQIDHDETGSVHLIGSQSPEYISEQWTTKNGLPINHVNQVYQTPDGFIWLATFTGLLRFDGVTFKEFNSGNTPALPSNRIIAIQPGAGNSFWINSEQGHLILYENGEFTSFDERLSSDLTSGSVNNRIFIQQDGLQTWIATKNGLFLYRKNEISSFKPEIFKNKSITALHLSRDNHILIHDSDGYLWTIGTEREIVESIKTPGISGASHIFENQEGSVWVTRNEIARIDSNGYQTISTPDDFKKDWDQLHPYYLSIKEVNEGQLFVMSLNGLLEIEDNTLTPVDFIDYQSYGSLPEFLGHSFTKCPDSSVWTIVENRVYKNGELEFRTGANGKTIYCDREDNLWVSTMRDGLFRYRKSIFQNITFEHTNNIFYGVFSDSYNTLWAGGFFSDLTQIDISGQIFDVVNRKNEGTTATFFESSDGTIWNGYHYCKPENRTEAGACLDFERVDELLGKNVFTVLEDSNNRMWFGTNEGLFRLENGEIKPIPAFHRNVYHLVRYLIETDDGTIWMATNGNGVLRYKDDLFEAFSVDQGLSSNNIRALVADSLGYIWIVSEDRGLNRLNLETGEIKVIRKADGLFDDGLHNMIPDDRGRMWISTNRGIFWVPLKQLHDFADGKRSEVQSVSYNDRDGMLNREANGGFQNTGFKSEDGRLYFTTQEGIVMIDPDQIDLNYPVPDVIIEEIISDNKTGLITSGVTSLKNDQRSFTIKYSAPFFSAPERLRFQYMLEGFDQNWINVDSRREAIYTNVPAGEYQFLVQVDLGENQSRSVAASHAVVISPYFYETAWFPILIILTFGLLIAYGYRLRLRQLIKREAILGKLVERRTEDLRSEKIKTEQQAEQLKILANEKNRFFANISHEFRTPLTLTIGPLTDLKIGKYGGLPPVAKQQIELSLRNARRLLRLVGQLMDLARLEDKKFDLTLQTGNLCRYLKTLSEPFEAAAIQKQIDFRVILPEKPIYVEFDPGHFDKIVANLLSNAFKFTSENGTITLQIISQADQARISVSDTGSGIEPQYIPHLFDRFYQIQKSEMQPGSGIGLSLAKELIELHGGQIRVESEVGVGSVFTLSMPLATANTNGITFRTSSNISSDILEEQAVLDSAEQVVNNDLDDLNDSHNMLKTILIVDDHSDIRAYLKRHLEELYNIIEASSGNEAIALLNQHLPDLVISDVMMSDGDGFSLLSYIRSEPEMDFLPVILLTARAEAEDKLSGLNIGANDYITKPFSIREVLARLKNIFDQQKRLAQQIKNGRPVNGTKIHHDTVSAQSTDQQFLTTVKTVIQEELSDENFTVEELSEKVNQSRSNLHRRLTKLTGETPSALIRRIRLELGAQLLAQNAGTVSEIAYSTGFKNVAHFSRVFKEHYSQTPTEFAQSQEKEMT
ncbi:hybrid sensor histidine kinase/response regulator transcription factor [Rhodohalobacter barkolensis]|uniref:histidine kinase n=1 Tax=Rhodohalobacter barkolensis TaxID=2053187 RepID=A0A2N0VGN3_9BACT|nr:hybrid sensor histidine kinase/response regulator transcription factor [Rhodohalobacter barkolensis]PKD43333.1 hypothetical protein CWD77_12040 [Rhodohalobacter barkolensis]